MARRVLHVVPSLAPRYGGPSAATIGMCRALANAGTTALVATTDADGPGRLPVPTGTVTEFAGVSAIFFARQLSESFKWSPPLATWLRDHVTEFDLVHVHAVFSHSALAASRACRAASVPYVVRPLGTLDPWSLARHAWRKQLLMLGGARGMLRGATAVHYTARQEQQRAELRSPWLPRGIVVPLGVDDELLDGDASDARRGPPTLVTMSRLDAKKGLELLIRAFHRTATDRRLSDWRLLIAGDGPRPYVDLLKRLAQTGPAANRIEFLGWVSSDERHALLSRARLFALPSQQENFGIALVEAMAAGAPVLICPRVDLAAEIDLAGAGWVSERTPDAIAEALHDAMTSGDELDRRGSRARQFAQRFRWARVADLLHEMYDAVLYDPAPQIPRSLSPARQA